MRTIAVLTTLVCLPVLAAAAPSIPRPARELTLTLPSGPPATLSAYKGKVVLIQFLYTNCVHCQATARLNSKLQTDLAPQGLQVLGAAFNAPALAAPELIREFIATNAVTFPVGAVTRDNVFAFLDLSVMADLRVPQIVIIDRHGVIRVQSDPQGTAELQDENHLRAILGDLLKQH